MDSKKQVLNIKLTVDELNLIFRALGRLPFEQVFELIGNLNAQSNEQLGNTGNSLQGPGTSMDNNNPS